MKKHIEVVAAIIVKDGMIFAAQRGYGFLKGKWEFPGGKVEAGETEPQALKREIKEELNSEITVERYFDTVDYEYETFSITMKCYVCTLVSGNLDINPEIHMAKNWLNKDTLLDEDWASADLPIAKEIFADLSKKE